MCCRLGEYFLRAFFYWKALFALGRWGSLDACGGAGGGGRGYDCGPEPSLRTAPASTSYAFGSLRFPLGASTRPALPRLPRHTLALRLNRRCWGGLFAWRFCRRGRGGGSCGARRQAAARAAFCGLRGVLRRDDGAVAYAGICDLRGRSLWYAGLLGGCRARICGGFSGCALPRQFNFAPETSTACFQVSSSLVMWAAKAAGVEPTVS